MTESKQPSQFDKRKYIRVKGNFPIEFTVVRLQDDVLDLPWQKGWTSNISQGGLCLETDVLSESLIRYLNKRNLYLDLQVHVPTFQKKVKVIAEVMWYEKMAHRDNCYMIGLEYRSILDDDRKLLFNKAKWVKKISNTLIFLAVTGFGYAVTSSLLTPK